MPNNDGVLVFEDLEAKNRKITYKIETVVEINRQDIIDLIITAVDGIGYWSAVSEYDFEEGTCFVHVEHDACFNNKKHKHYETRRGLYEAKGIEVNPEMFLEGIKKYNNYWKDQPNYKGLAWSVENQDSDIADAMMQFAVLNDIVYG